MLAKVMENDRDRLSVWLESNGLALIPGSGLRLLGGGLANRNERIELTTGPAVLRRPPPGVLAAGASDMAREARVMRALAPVMPLVPRLLAYCEDASVLGTPFVIIEYRAGIAIGGDLPPGCASAAAGQLLATTLNQMFALRRIDAAAIGLGDLGRPDGFYARQLSGWAKRAAMVWPHGLPADAAALLAALQAGDAPDPGPPVLLHMDLKPDNLLVDPATMQPIAIIDWDMATRGPRDFDLAILLSYWIEPGDPAALHALNAVPSLISGIDRSAVMQLHDVFGGQRHGPLAWPVALARLRLGIAWGQLYRKWQRGEHVGDRYVGFETLAAAIFAHALRQLQQDLI